MNARLKSVLMAMLLAVASTPLLCAQGAKTSTPVAVIDIGYIFKNHPRFKQAMDTVRARVKDSESKFQTRGKDIQSRVLRLKQLKPESAEFKQLEGETARLQAQVEADMKLQRKEFLGQEAQVYYAIYQEVQSEIKTFADNHGIGLVLRFSAEQIDVSNRQSVMEGVNRPVVYQRNLNITYDVLDRLQRSGGQQPRTARSPAASGGTAPRTNAPRSR